MPQTRLYIPDPLRAGTRVTLSPDQAHYVGRVLRLRPGSTLTVFDGSSREFRAVVVELGKSRATLDIGDAEARNVESPLAVRLVQGISRGERMDFAIQKATELGVAEICPVVTLRSVVRLSGDRADKRRAHWQRIAASACEQSGRTVVPTVRAPVALDAFLGENSDAALRIALSPEGHHGIGATGQPQTGMVELLVGPEGGLNDDELRTALAAGFHACSMGPRVLRTETAGVAALAILQALWGDLDPDG